MKTWKDLGNKLVFNDPNTSESPVLEKEVYGIRWDSRREEFYLERISKEFDFSYKVYGFNQSFVDRVVKTYANLNGNLGILFNGLKGTGKTVTAKRICNSLNLPVLVITRDLEGIELFLSSIKQDFIIFVDEYEKIFREEDTILTLMDGVLSGSENRKVFLLTTNDLNINTNLLQRPGRIRYLQTFENLDMEVIKEIVDDCLIYPHHRQDILDFIETLEMITVDICKSIITEVNIHNQSPEDFKEIFNVQQRDKENIMSILTSGGWEQFTGAGIVTPNELVTEKVFTCKNDNLYLSGKYIGEILKKIGENHFLVSNERVNYNDFYEENETVDEFLKREFSRIRKRFMRHLGKEFQNCVLDNEGSFEILITPVPFR